MKKIETLRQLQEVNIFIYKELLNVCNNNGIKLYLLGGTLIGAVRHKGFIPWDDDMDLCMSRPDYNRLLELTNGKIGEHCSIVDPKTDNGFRGYIPLCVYNNSVMETKQYREKEALKIGLSIFIYDGAPKSKFSQFFYYKRMYLLRAKHALCRADFKNVNTKAAKLFGPFLAPFFKTYKVYKYKSKILKLQEKYKYEQSELVCTNADKDSKLEICFKADFEHTVFGEFEGIKSSMFSHYDKHLKKYYGDYMIMPAENARIPKHSFYAEIEDDFVFCGEE